MVLPMNKSHGITTPKYAVKYFDFSQVLVLEVTKKNFLGFSVLEITCKIITCEI